MKSIKKFEGKKIDLSADQKGGRTPIFGDETTQGWDGGTDATRGDGFKTNVDWNPFNNDQV